jgi:hypothetical protein
MGGVCALGDNCDVIQQNCPDLPADRSSPAGPDNPLVAQNCTPVAPTVNACEAAGSIPLWGIGCDQSCTNLAVDCAKGGVCVTTVDQNGNPVGPSECRQQCRNPSTAMTSNADCPANRPYCEGTYAAGMVYYTTGVCTEAPCFANTDCAGFSTTPCCNANAVCDVCPAPADGGQ